MKSPIAGLLLAVSIPALGLAQTTTGMVSPGLVQFNSPDQVTSCMGGQGLVTCQTTNMGLTLTPPTQPPPPDYRSRQDLANAEANFGSALGDAFARIRERAEQRKIQNRQLAEEALQRGDCTTARLMATKDKDMLTYVDSTCTQMAARASQEAAQTRINGEIQAFAADPSHPRFNQVKAQMAQLLQSGRAHTLQEAYDMATAGSPDLASQSGPLAAHQ